MTLSEAREIVGRYGEVLEKHSEEYKTIMPESLLPFPKGEIKYALLVLYHFFVSTKDEKENLGAVFVMLSGFVSYEDAQLWQDGYKEMKRGNAPKKELNRVMDLVAEEAKKLLIEWNEQIKTCKILPPTMTEGDREMQITKIIQQRNIEVEKRDIEFEKKWGKLLIGLVFGILIGAFLFSSF